MLSVDMNRLMGPSFRSVFDMPTDVVGAVDAQAAEAAAAKQQERVQAAAKRRNDDAAVDDARARYLARKKAKKR